MKVIDSLEEWGMVNIDLSEDAQRQVVVDREPGQYLGHPTTLTLDDGHTVIAVYPKGHGRGQIVLKKSCDRGHTWSQRLPVPQSFATSREVPTLFKLREADGRARIVLFSGLYPIRMAASEDGLTWSELQEVFPYGGIVAMGEVIALKDGSYMALFHDDGRYFTSDRGAEAVPPDFTVYKTFSKDAGRTWSTPQAALKYADAHICEPGIIRSPDGSELLMLLRENSRKYNSLRAVSRDEGESFADVRCLPAALTGDRHVIRYLPDGRLFVSFRDTYKGSPTWGDWVAWIGRYEDIIEGKAGQYRVRLMQDHSERGGDCAYPGVEIYEDGSIMTTTYGHWTEGEEPYIVSVHLNINELDAMQA